MILMCYIHVKMLMHLSLAPPPPILCQVDAQLDDSQMSAYKVTFVLAYLLVGSHVIMFITLMFKRDAISGTGESFF